MVALWCAACRTEPASVPRQEAQKLAPGSAQEDEATAETMTAEEADKELAEVLQAVESAQRRYLHWIPNASDHEEAMAVIKYLEASYPFPAKVYMNPQVTVTIISVYEILEKDEQDRVLQLAREEKARRGWKPIRIVFLTKEIWRVRDLEDGGRWSVRGSEEVLREELIR